MDTSTIGSTKGSAMLYFGQGTMNSDAVS